MFLKMLWYLKEITGVRQVVDLTGSTNGNRTLGESGDSLRNGINRDAGDIKRLGEEVALGSLGGGEASRGGSLRDEVDVEGRSKALDLLGGGLGSVTNGSGGSARDGQCKQGSVGVWGV